VEISTFTTVDSPKAQQITASPPDSDGERNPLKKSDRDILHAAGSAPKCASQSKPPAAGDDLPKEELSAWSGRRYWPARTESMIPGSTLLRMAREMSLFLFRSWVGLPQGALPFQIPFGPRKQQKTQLRRSNKRLEINNIFNKL
jgi:hypothetical protein